MSDSAIPEVYRHKKFGFCTIEETDVKLHPGLTEDYVFVKLLEPPENTSRVVLVDRDSLTK